MLRSVDKGKVMVLLTLNGHTDPRTGIRSDEHLLTPQQMNVNVMVLRLCKATPWFNLCY